MVYFSSDSIRNYYQGRPILSTLFGGVIAACLFWTGVSRYEIAWHSIEDRWSFIWVCLEMSSASVIENHF